jgi:hypothetical protein
MKSLTYKVTFWTPGTYQQHTITGMTLAEAELKAQDRKLGECASLFDELTNNCMGSWQIKREGM